VARIGIRLIDEAYMSWCTAQLQCQNALRAWFDAGPRDRAEANCAYRAALDREQAAARDLSLWRIRSSRSGPLDSAERTTTCEGARTLSRPARRGYRGPRHRRGSP
jgi:hypothetical protein